MSRIAIIGTGISGITVAWHLHRAHEVVLFEANDYVGGHTATRDVELGGRHYAIDTGFIVFNDWTYRTSSPCSRRSMLRGSGRT